MIILARELAITGLRAIAVNEGVVIAASEGGKAKTTFGTIGVVGLLIHYPYVINYGFVAHTVDFHLTGLWLTYVSAIYSVWSAVDYTWGFVRGLKTQPASSAER
jgi:CDP-diacylglycerol--glycerol-3-phosphate 3-phosphatidyltransferase